MGHAVTFYVPAPFMHSTFQMFGIGNVCVHVFFL